MKVLQNPIALDWDLGSFLENAVKTVQQWGKWIILLIGIIMVLFGVYKIARGFISHGKQQTDWVIAILLILVGGALFAGGMTWVLGIAQSGKTTIEELGSGGTSTIMPAVSRIFSFLGK